MHAATSWIYKSSRKGLRPVLVCQGNTKSLQPTWFTYSYKWIQKRPVRRCRRALTHSYSLLLSSLAQFYSRRRPPFYISHRASLIFCGHQLAQRAACLARTRRRRRLDKYMQIPHHNSSGARASERATRQVFARLFLWPVWRRRAYSKIQIPSQERFGLLWERDERSRRVSAVCEKLWTARGSGLCCEGVLLFGVQLFNWVSLLQLFA